MTRMVYTPDDPALPMNYPGFVFRTLREKGYPADALLAGTELEEKRLNDPHFRCGFQPLRRLFLNAIAQTEDPHLGIKLALDFQPTYIGLPAYTAMNAANFRDGLEVLERYIILNFPALDFSLVTEPSSLEAGDAAIRLRSKFPFGDIEYFGISSAIVAINGLLRAMLQADEVANRAEMAIAMPEGFRSRESQIGFHIRFGAPENQIVFPKALLSFPLPGADPINHVRLLGLCEQFAAEMSFEATPVTEVLAVLEDAPSMTVALADVAAKLGYSERGLRRQLERSGTSYRMLVSQVREQRARDLLLNTTLPIKTIADDLGFESASNFGRSFKRWTGKTPKAFRQDGPDTA